MLIAEDKRTQLLQVSKSAKREKDGKTRYQKRVKSKVKANVNNLNKIDFNKLFKDNIVSVNLEVQGETDTYTVTVAFGGFLDRLKTELKRNKEELNLKIVIRALLNAFNSDNVKVRCTCDDFKYRQSYYLSVEGNIAGEKETRPSDITNPNNDLGDGCKHIMLVLSNQSWVIKLASVIFNYINYMEKSYKKLYADIIYPAIYGKKYEEPVQLDIDTLDKDELDTDEETVSKSNVYARDKGKFKQGNVQGVRFAPKERNMRISDLKSEE